MRLSGSDSEEIVRHALEEGIRVKSRLLEECVPAIVRVAQLLVKTFAHGRKVVLFGNGGSAADAQHAAAEFVNRFRRERLGLPAIALTTDTSVLTSVANDRDFSQVFSRQVRVLVRKGDVAVGLSTSGNSANVLNGITTAHELKAVTAGFTGSDGGKLRTIVDYCLCVPSNDTPRVQEGHIAAWHAICEYVERTLLVDEVGGLPRPRRHDK